MSTLQGKLKQGLLSLGKRPASPTEQRSAKHPRLLGSEPDVAKNAGPSTQAPLNINPPSFDVAESFSGTDGEVIKKKPGLDLLYLRKFLVAPGRQQLFTYLLEELPWYRVKYKARGMNINTPRWTCVWGSNEIPSSVAVWKKKPRDIPLALLELKKQVEKVTGEHFNFVLCNYYADGKDSISWHSDDEKFLGPLPTIASLSLGSPREFLMKHKTDKSAPTEKWTLESGDMIVMRGTTQSQWLHSVPKRANAGGRMNITFRKAINAQGTNNYYHYNVGDGPVHRWRGGVMVEM